MSGGRFPFRRCARVLLALLLVSSVALASLSYPFFTTTTDSVRLRKTASSRAIVLENLAAGTRIEVLGQSGSYYKVRVGNTTGYLLKDYVNTDESAISTATPVVVETVTGYPYVTVTLEGVNLRETKSLQGKLLKQIPSGASIVVRANSGTWAEVEYDGLVGYVKNAYILLKKVVAATATPAPTATPNPEGSGTSYVILMVGSEGAEVRALQAAMLELGFLRGTVDGKFGAATENAVVLFQGMNEYPISGIADENLQAFLYAGKPKNAQGVATQITTMSPVYGATMKLGKTGEPVGRLQLRLMELGYYSGEVTSIYDNATKKAVAAFQKKNGLTADGVAGKDTQDLIYSAGALAVGETAAPTATPTPTPVPVFTIPSGKVQLHSEGSDAKLVQQRLKDLGYYRGRVDGIFGSASVAALKKFQENNGLQADGVAGESTYRLLFSWGALASGCTATPAPTAEGATATPVPTGTVTPQVTPAPVYETLRKGMTGDAVKLMQEALINLGYLSGTSDGNYGDATVSAVRAFQKTNGLTVDGIAGNQTLQVLYSIGAKAAPVTATPAPTATAKATATPTATAKGTQVTPTPTPGNLKQGSTGNAVKEMQERLIALGYLSGKADGIFGAKTFAALVAFQKANRLTADGIFGVKTQKALSSSSAKTATGATAAPTTVTATATPKPTAPAVTAYTKPRASQVLYANWYTTIKSVAKKYPYATVYDYQSGISWQVHIFSVGAHADYEPLTANDTAKMLQAFGSNTWNPKAVWVLFANGSVYIGSTHSMPHGTQHRTDNNFAGHSCLHFPRTQAQVEAIGTYATSHQKCIDAGWTVTQAMQ